MKRFFLISSQKKKNYLSHKTIVQQFFLLKNIVSRGYPSGFVVYYTAVFSVVTQRSSPQTFAGGGGGGGVTTLKTPLLQTTEFVFFWVPPPFRMSVAPRGSRWGGYFLEPHIADSCLINKLLWRTKKSLRVV